MVKQFDFTFDGSNQIYFYYSNPGWGDFNMHLAMFKNAVHYTKEIGGEGAVLVLQGDYELWDYLDVERLRDAVPLTYSNLLDDEIKGMLHEYSLRCYKDAKAVLPATDAADGDADCMR